MSALDLDQFMKEVHGVAKDHGWWDFPYKSPLECMALMVSELAEAMEETRHQNSRPPIYQVQEGIFITPSSNDPHNPQRLYWDSSFKPEGEAVELADCIIRILDYCAFHELPIVEALQLKNEYNKSRPYKHGKKI